MACRCDFWGCGGVFITLSQFFGLKLFILYIYAYYTLYFIILLFFKKKCDNVTNCM